MLRLKDELLVLRRRGKVFNESVLVCITLHEAI